MKNHSRLAIVLSLSATCTFAQTGVWSAPWKDSATAIVIDPYAANAIDWDKLATDPRVIGIIHQATQGAATDKKYASRKLEALKRKYRWGSYHLGKPGDPTVQADFYLGFVRPSADEVMALDIETLDPQKSMTLKDARTFMQRVKEKTGRYPMIYGNQEVVKQISRDYPGDAVFGNAGLWYARFKDSVKDFPVATWKSYTLWQFSCEINCSPKAEAQCPYRVPGTQTDMDINVYAGTVAEAKAKWPFDAAAVPAPTGVSAAVQ